MGTRALSSVQPLLCVLCNPSPSTPSFLLHTHPAHTNTATAPHSYRMQRSHRPKMDPFTAERGRYNQKHSTPAFSWLNTLPPSLSTSVSLSLSPFTDTKHKALEFNSSYMFPVRKFYTRPLVQASVLKQQHVGMFAHTWSSQCICLMLGFYPCLYLFSYIF